MKAAVALFALLSIYGVHSYLTTTYEKVVTTAVAGGPARCIEMLGSTTREENGYTYIVGNVRNNCERPVSSVTVTFKREDASKAIAYAYVRDLKANETRPFKSFISVGKNDTYRFDKINAF